MSEGRSDRTAELRIPEEPGQADIARNTRDDVLLPVFHNLLRKEWIGNHRPAHLPDIQLAVCHGLFRDLRNEEAIGHADRDLDILLHALCDIEPVPHGNVSRDDGDRRFLPSRGDAQVVDPCLLCNLDRLQAFLRRIATPVVEQFLTAEADPDGHIRGDGLSNPFKDLLHKPASTVDVPPYSSVRLLV